MSGSTGKAGLRENAPRPSDCSTLTDALTFIACCVCVCFFFSATCTRRPHGRTPASLSYSRLQRSIRSPAPRSTPTPSATQRPLRNQKTLFLRQVSHLQCCTLFFLSSVSLEYVGWYFFGIPSWLLTLIHLFTCAYATYYINLNQGLVSFLTVN